jgi:protein TonB
MGVYAFLAGCGLIRERGCGMFEQSVLRGEGGRRRTWIALGSVVAQVGVLTALVVVPLVDPARMPALTRPMMLKEVHFEKPPVVTPPKPVVVRTTAEARSAPASVPQVASAARGPIIARRPTFSSDAPVMLAVGMMRGDASPGVGFGVVPGNVDGPVVTVKPAAAGGGDGRGPLHISTGVMAGRLLSPIQPQYPQIAKAAHVEGTVVVTVTIDRSGRIVGLQVVSGPAMLRGAAVDAIRDARYQPYLLNGTPTAVETTIAVNFRMGG